MRDGAADVAEVLARQGRYQTARDDLRIKEVRVGDGESAKRSVICHNPEGAERQKQIRDHTIRRLEAKLEWIDTQRQKAKTAKTDKARQAAAHTKAECAQGSPLAGKLSAPGTVRKVEDQPREHRERTRARRQLPALHERPGALSRGPRAGLQNRAKPSAGCASSRARSSCGSCSTASSTASARTSSSAGARCC